MPLPECPAFLEVEHAWHIEQLPERLREFILSALERRLRRPDIQTQLPAWQGCDAELAAVADELARYYELGGR
jgi:hypothetical protein